MRSKDSVTNTLFVSITLSLVASVLVSGTAIVLKPVQERNEALFRQQIILDVAGLWSPGDDVASEFGNIETRVVDLATGEFSRVDTGSEDDSAEIYLVYDGDDVDQIILPVEGPGLWSTMRGFLSMDPDGTTVRGLRFYEHAETPGLGDQIDNDDWRAQWIGKQVFAGDDVPRIEVVRGRVDASSADAIHQVDGIAGATLTGRGVMNLVRYWTGPDGFGPFLARQRREASGDD